MEMLVFQLLTNTAFARQIKNTCSIRHRGPTCCLCMSESGNSARRNASATRAINVIFTILAYSFFINKLTEIIIK
ncbi:hypothetical protein Bca4012_098196 [Brassica carinata]